MKPKSRYTVYDTEKDVLIIADGTAEECAKALGISVGTFRLYISSPRRNLCVEKTKRLKLQDKKEAWKRGWVKIPNGFPEDSEPVNVIVSGKYKNVEFVSAVMLASYDDEDDGGWILEEYPEWVNPDIEYWCYTPPLPLEARKHIEERMGEE